MALQDRIQADRAKFVNPSLFGEAATYNGATPVNVLFNEAGEIVDPLDNDSVLIAPVAMASAADIPAAQKGQTLLVRGTTYYITFALYDDGANGMVQLALTIDQP